MKPTQRKSLIQQYDIDSGILSEIREKEQSGWVFITAEHDLNDLGRTTGIADLASQCALGNREKVLTGEVDTTLKATREKVRLTLYFVERLQYEEACRERQRKRLEQEHNIPERR